jgi:hypothetical protein
VLAEQGIEFDMSICSGVKYDNAVIKLDYTKCEEPLLPYHPEMHDARRVARSASPIICVPTFSFRPSVRLTLKQDFRRFSGMLRPRAAEPVAGTPATSSSALKVAEDAYTVWSQQPTGGIKSKILARFNPEVRIADLSALSFEYMVEMIGAVRRSARSRSISHAPIILENHTKDITNFDAFERFAAYVASQNDFEVITLKELASRLEAGEYGIVNRSQAAA